MITLTINGKKVKANDNTTLLEISRKLSIPIPTLCHHPDLAPRGSCRLCTVEVSENGKTRMVTACNYPAREGIEVQTHSAKVLQTRRILAELLLARCPEVAFIQNLARELGVEKTPFKTEDPGNNCILCGLCVRTCQEIVGADAIGFSRRGTLKKIGTPFEVDSDRCFACGACEYICPTGAVKMELNRTRRMKLSGTGTRRYCRYMRLGLIDFMVCSNGFECWRCEVDQNMEDRFETHPAFALKPAKKKQPLSVRGFIFHPEILYGGGHVWAQPLDRLLRLGLDDMVSAFAIEADSVNIPPVGSTLKKGQILAEIISGNKAAAIFAPLSGRVCAVNRDVEESPGLIWRDPYQRGWLLMMEPESPEEFSHFYSNESARAWFKQEVDKLAAMVMEGVPNRHKRDVNLDQSRVREIVRSHWDEMKEILLGQQ